MVISIVIAAHNEEAVIGRCLDSLLADADVGEFDVTVAANGCTDGTAEVAARRAGVRVLDLPDAGKARALNAADEVAVGFPRVYLDADIFAGADVARALCAALDAGRPEGGDGPVLAAVPRRDVDVVGRPLLVKGYFAISGRLPVFRNGLFGRGMIAVSEQGRARFERFPEMVADDLFLDSQFTEEEKCQVIAVGTMVETPRTTKDLVRRLIRVRRGNSAMRAAGRAGEIGASIRQADRTSWLRDVVFPNPRLLPAGIAYFSISVWASLLARRAPTNGNAWGRDESTRTGPQPGKVEGERDA
ncbi:MAG TPA: glycosyltransferase family 2 protein [Nakamurella multipartita]|nr:glycosyltransferase family 2 protein [Nakamurella multipartita]